MIHPLLQKIEILWIFICEEFFAFRHVSPRELVCSAVKNAELELALTESKMKKGITDSVRTPHCSRKIVASCLKVVRKKVRVTDGGKNPRSGFPLFFWLRQDVPGGQVFAECLRILRFGRQLITFPGQVHNSRMERIRKLGHPPSLTPWSADGDPPHQCRAERLRTITGGGGSRYGASKCHEAAIDPSTTSL